MLRDPKILLQMEAYHAMQAMTLGKELAEARERLSALFQLRTEAVSPELDLPGWQDLCEAVRCGTARSEEYRRFLEIARKLLSRAT